MSTITSLHDLAMDYADQAYLAKRRGEITLFDELTRKALQQEVAAADLLKDDINAEPTRSVLYRSAASLAIDCGEFREAERLIAKALSGEPPAEIAEELRDLLEQVNFARHLKLQNVELQSGELQLSVTGKAVGYGIALSEILVDRIKDMERLIHRTVERILGRDFRERGSANKSIQDGYNLYIAAPRPGSFAVTLRLGRQTQTQLSGFDISDKVIDEILECLQILNDGQDDCLRNRIPEESYFQNFVGLAKRIAPDGEKVRMVGLTKLTGSTESHLALTRTQSDISSISLTPSGSDKDVELVTVQGRLLYADARKSAGKIQLIDPRNVPHYIIVPEGMMDDIVKPLWDEIVLVSGIQTKSGISLKEISKIESM
jgi:hypothetical protein